jgi:hypothetical protein
MLTRINAVINMIMLFFADARKEFDKLYEEYVAVNKEFLKYEEIILKKTHKVGKRKSGCLGHSGEASHCMHLTVTYELSPEEESEYLALREKKEKVARKINEFFRKTNEKLKEKLEIQIYYDPCSSFESGAPSTERFHKLLGTESILMILETWRAYIKNSEEDSVKVSEFINRTTVELITSDWKIQQVMEKQIFPLLTFVIK